MDDRTRSFALAPMSPLVAVATWLLLALAVVLPAVIAIWAPREHGLWMAAGLAMFLWAVFLFIWGFYRPRRFEVGPDGLTIHWPWRRRFIPAALVLNVQRVSRAHLGWMIRTFGAGGLFGGFGQFYSRRLGHLAVYVSSHRDLVLVDLARARSLLISPDRPDEFVEAVRAAIEPPTA